MEFFLEKPDSLNFQLGQTRRSHWNNILWQRVCITCCTGNVRRCCHWIRPVIHRPETRVIFTREGERRSNEKAEDGSARSGSRRIRFILLNPSFLFRRYCIHYGLCTRLLYPRFRLIHIHLSSLRLQTERERESFLYSLSLLVAKNIRRVLTKQKCVSEICVARFGIKDCQLDNVCVSFDVHTGARRIFPQMMKTRGSRVFRELQNKDF